MIAQKCTGCSHLIDNDPDWTVPRCVDQCPTEAIQFGAEEDFQEFIAEAQLINPEAGTKSRVYYKNLPKKFIGGTLYDPDQKEVIVGAECALQDLETGEVCTTETDNFGDFWFNDLEDDRTFTLSFKKDADSLTLEEVTSEQDLSLGDIPMRLQQSKEG
jgi:ferredoxin